MIDVRKSALIRYNVYDFPIGTLHVSAYGPEEGFMRQYATTAEFPARVGTVRINANVWEGIAECSNEKLEEYLAQSESKLDYWRKAPTFWEIEKYDDERNREKSIAAAYATELAARRAYPGLRGARSMFVFAQEDIAMHARSIHEKVTESWNSEWAEQPFRTAAQLLEYLADRHKNFYHVLLAVPAPQRFNFAFAIRAIASHVNLPQPVEHAGWFIRECLERKM